MFLKLLYPYRLQLVVHSNSITRTTIFLCNENVFGFIVLTACKHGFWMGGNIWQWKRFSLTKNKQT